MTSRISIYNKYGYYLCDLRATTVRSWIKNCSPNPGECRFIISKYDAKFSRKYLEHGNFIYVRHASLPDWIGIIVTRRWANGYVEVKALQAEYILKKRPTPIIDVLGVTGSLFAQVVGLTNGLPYNEKPIYVNNVYYANPERQQRLGSDALSIIQDLAERSGNDFDFQFLFTVNGNGYLSANWYQRRGQMTNKVLREGYNIRMTDGLLEEDSRATVNYLEGRGDASTAGTRYNYTAWDEESIAAIGLNAGSVVFNQNKEQVTVTDSTLNLLKRTKNPDEVYDITALNVGSTFSYLDIGNIQTIDLYSAGFDPSANPYVSTIGMEYDDDIDTCRLIVEKYYE